MNVVNPEPVVCSVGLGDKCKTLGSKGSYKHKRKKKNRDVPGLAQVISVSKRFVFLCKKSMHACMPYFFFERESD